MYIYRYMKKALVLSILLGAATVLSAADGSEIWAKQCAKCHGKDGRGDTVMGKKMGAKDYTQAKNQEAVTDDNAIKSVKEGFKVSDKVVMKPIDGVTDDEVKAVIAHMRSLKK